MSQFDKNSGGYIFGYAVLLTIILGSVLAFTSESLKEKQAAEREFERKKFILAAALGRANVDAMVAENRQDVEALYDNRVKNFVVNANGEKQEGMTAKSVNVSKEFKKPAEERVLPVYTVSKENSEEVEYFVLPVYGNGLWDNIWGYVSLQSDLNTVQGVIFDHKGETPGLGARITEAEVQNRYEGKKIYEGDDLVSVQMQKGEGADYSSAPHKVNGMTGATITGNGLNDMMLDYMKLYESYFKNFKQNN
ncbi:NADH:ubiquinone reductase (Na(+)-transporting) subunit C [bacterium]|nr:NADH:ubiquinone reductase (Na(+)-transporting) subunit C [bacterium]